MPPPSALDRWMWLEACELLAKAERLQREFFRLGPPDEAEAQGAAWEPPVDVFDDGREIVVVVAMPGIAAERLQVRLAPGWLTVSGWRPLPAAGARLPLRRLEIPYGAFARRIALPPGRIEMQPPPELLQGCLTVRLRRLGTERGG